MSKLLTHQGNCHCGANRYEVQLSDLPALVICDCMLCTKKGYVWIYDAEDSLKITKGCTAETLTTYVGSDTEALLHEFCSNCGTGLFGTHKYGAQAGKRGISLRALVSEMNGIFIKGKDVITLNPSGQPETYPGSLSFIEKSASTKPAKFRGTPPEKTKDNDKLYIGGCDCGAVQIALQTQPLSDVEIKEDNCSICIRNGSIGVYPHQSQVILVGKDHTHDYQFGRKFNGSPFCRTCGVHCFGNLYGPPKEIIARLPEAKQDFVRKQLEIQPLNIRVLDGVDWDRIDIKWSNEGTEGYKLGE
ncbi:hypothetical protein EsH8_VIII_000298 [Colletotrichum jinshuiense]